MARRRDNEIARVQAQSADQRRWIDEHGGDRAGYAARYGDSGDGAEVIYNADSAELRKLLERQSELEAK